MILSGFDMGVEFLSLLFTYSFTISSLVPSILDSWFIMILEVAYVDLVWCLPPRLSLKHLEVGLRLVLVCAKWQFQGLYGSDPLNIPFSIPVNFNPLEQYTSRRPSALQESSINLAKTPTLAMLFVYSRQKLKLSASAKQHRASDQGSTADLFHSHPVCNLDLV